jgi:hypothetical protein
MTALLEEGAGEMDSVQFAAATEALGAGSASMSATMR